jgi:large subunit ribosomal protein L5
MGNSALPLMERHIDFRNIPEIKEITLASYQPEAIKDPDHLLVARSVLLALTGTTPDITHTKSNVVQWGIKAGEKAGVKTTIYGNAAYEFLDRCVHMVFPRIKDWRGIRGEFVVIMTQIALFGGCMLTKGGLATTGDDSGNLAWGFTPEEIKLFPEVEVNYWVCSLNMTCLSGYP